MVLYIAKAISRRACPYHTCVYEVTIKVTLMSWSRWKGMIHFYNMGRPPTNLNITMILQGVGTYCSSCKASVSIFVFHCNTCTLSVEGEEVGVGRHDLSYCTSIHTDPHTIWNAIVDKNTNHSSIYQFSKLNQPNSILSHYNQHSSLQQPWKNLSTKVSCAELKPWDLRQNVKCRLKIEMCVPKSWNGLVIIWIVCGALWSLERFSVLEISRNHEVDAH